MSGKQREGISVQSAVTAMLAVNSGTAEVLRSVLGQSPLKKCLNKTKQIHLSPPGHPSYSNSTTIYELTLVSYLCWLAQQGEGKQIQT